MSIRYRFDMVGEMLLVTAAGCDDDAQEVIDYGRAVVAEAVERGARCVLCDERELAYALSTIDIFEAAKAIAAVAPRMARVAIVCGPAFLKDGQFWQTVAVNRGFYVRVDTDFDRARAWVLESLAQPAAEVAGGSA